MRVLRAIVEAFVLAMFNLKAHLRPRRSVGAELVRDHDAGQCDGGFQKPIHESLRRAGVSSTLDQDVENDAVLIDGAPEPVWLAGDRGDDLIHRPSVAPSRRALADLIGECLAELLPPLAHGLVGHANPARRQHFFDHAKAQGKPEIEPNRMADHLRRKAMALVERVVGCRHGGRIGVGVDPVWWTPLKLIFEVSDAPLPNRLSAGVPATNGRSGALWTHARRAGA